MTITSEIPGEYYAKPLNNTDLSWINNVVGYEKIAEEADKEFLKNRDQNELNLIKNFITKINNGTINNKNTAANEFRKLKQKVNDEILRQDLIKYLERYLFRENLENIEPRDDQRRTFAPPSPPTDYTVETDEYLKYLKEQEKDRKKFSDEYYSSGSGLNKNRKGLKILTNKQMLSRLPILLAQIPAGNNSIKLKNELRQILYSLYRSKVLTKTVYNNLIKVI